MLVEGPKLRKGLLVYRGILFDYINGRKFSPCFTMKQEAIEWTDKEASRGDYPLDVQKSVMWNTCESEGVAPGLEGAKSDSIL